MAKKLKKLKVDLEGRICLDGKWIEAKPIGTPKILIWGSYPFGFRCEVSLNEAIQRYAPSESANAYVFGNLEKRTLQELEWLTKIPGGTYCRAIQYYRIKS